MTEQNTECLVEVIGQFIAAETCYRHPTWAQMEQAAELQSLLLAGPLSDPAVVARLPGAGPLVDIARLAHIAMFDDTDDNGEGVDHWLRLKFALSQIDPVAMGWAGSSGTETGQ